MTLFKNSDTKVIFRSDDAQTDAAVSEITSDDVSALLADGYAVDQSAVDVTPNVAPSDASTVTPDASASSSASPASSPAATPTDSAVAPAAASTDSGSTASAAIAPTGAVDNPVVPGADPNAGDGSAISANAATVIADQRDNTQTLVTDPATGATTVQTDTDAPVAVQPDAPVTPTAPQLTAEEQAAVTHAAISDANAQVAASNAAVATPVDGTVIPSDDHATAKDYFASLMAKLHSFEAETVDELKEDLHAIGELLHLHSEASREAAQTGDYTAGDVSKE